MEFRRLAVKAMIQTQYPWVAEEDIYVKDNTNGYENPHYAVNLTDDGKEVSFNVEIKVKYGDYDE